MPISDSELFDLYSKPNLSAEDAAKISDVGRATSNEDLWNLYAKSATSTEDATSIDTGKQRVIINPERPSPERFAEHAAQYGVNVPTESVASQIATGIKNVPKNISKNIAESYQGGLDLAAQGTQQFESGGTANALKGAVKFGLGALGAAASPISGTIKTLVEDPTTQLTGNPEAGSRAGFIATSAIPGIPGGKAVQNKLPTNRAFNTIVEKVGEENLPEVIQRLESNPRLSIADVSPAARQMAQKLVVTEGPQVQNQLTKFVQGRQETAKGAVTGAYNEAMGGPVDALQKLNELQAKAKKVGAEQINPALAGSKPVDLTEVINTIDSKAKPGVNAVISAGEPLPSMPVIRRLNEIRKTLTDNKSMRVDPNQLHNIQSALRIEAEGLIGSASGQERLLGHAIGDIRNRIVGAIDEASGGKYKPALKNFRDEKQVGDAFQKGTEIFKTTNIEDRPEFFADWVKNAKDADIQAVKEGARIAVDKQIRGMRFAARRGADIPEVEFNAEKMRTLFGQKETDKLFSQLRDEKAIADTNKKLIENSQTAMRLASDEAVKIPEKVPFGKSILPVAAAEIGTTFLTGQPFLGSSAYLAAASAKKLANVGIRKLATERNKKITDYLTATGSDRDELINKLRDVVSQPKKSILQIGQGVAQRAGQALLP